MQDMSLSIGTDSVSVSGAGEARGPLAPGAHRFVSSGSELAYHVHGQGPVVVALPGGPGFSGSYLRMPLVEAALTVVYLDPVGTGGSARLSDPAGYGRARDVADLEALRQHLGLERIRIFGHSAGGFVAQQYALTHPGRVERLALCSTTATTGPDFDASLGAQMQARAWRPWFADAAAALSAFYSRPVGDEEARALLGRAWPLYFSAYEDAPDLAARLLASLELNVARFQQAPPEPFDFRPALASLRTRALVMVGAADFLCSQRLAELLHGALPDAQLVTFPHSGHMPHAEEPESFAAALTAFLREPA